MKYPMTPYEMMNFQQNKRRANTMDFWNTVLGVDLARSLLSNLPNLEKLEQLDKLTASIEALTEATNKQNELLAKIAEQNAK